MSRADDNTDNYDGTTNIRLWERIHNTSCEQIHTKVFKDILTSETMSMTIFSLHDDPATHLALNLYDRC